MGEPDYALSDADVDDYENRDDTWEDDWGDVEGEACVSLFSAEVLPSMAACCQHDSDNFGFDFRTFRSQVRFHFACNGFYVPQGILRGCMGLASPHL